MSRLRPAHLLAWNGLPIQALGLALALAIGLLLARMPLVDGLILLSLAGLAAATVIEPLVGVAGSVMVGLLRAYLQTEVPHIPAQIGHLFFALAVAAWLAQRLARRDLRVRFDLATLIPLLGFVGAGWLSLWPTSGGALHGLRELFKWIQILTILVLVADRARTRRHLALLTAAVLLIGLFQAGVGLYQFALRGEGPDHFLIPGYSFYRAYGTFEQPNPYAGYVGITLALAVGVVLAGRGQVRGLALVAAAALAAALGASWSRGAWIGFAAALAAMAFALPRRARWGLLAIGLLAVIGLALYSTGRLPASVTDRLIGFVADLRLEDVRGVGITPVNYAVVERLAHWQAALDMWRSSFWTGVGLGGYEPVYAAFALVNWPFALGHAHNIYLNLLAETGLIGLTAYVTLWVAVFWQTWQATRRADGLERGVAVGLLGAWTHLTVHHLFDNLYVNNVHLLLGLLIGLLALVYRSEQVR